MLTTIHGSITAEIAARLRVRMYPRLREMPAGTHGEALRVARRTELDMLERIGIFGGLAGTTAILQAVGADWSSTLARYTAQFVLALPLLCCAVGPFLLRRTRRGLDEKCMHTQVQCSAKE